MRVNKGIKEKKRLEKKEQKLKKLFYGYQKTIDKNNELKTALVQNKQNAKITEINLIINNAEKKADKIGPRYFDAFIKRAEF